MSMAVVSNVMTAVLVAPFIFLLAAVSLNCVQRLTEWIASLAKGTGYTGYMKSMKPYAKQVHQFFERILGKEKIAISTQNILLMAIVVAVVALTLTLTELHSEAAKTSKKEAKEAAKKAKKDRSD